MNCSISSTSTPVCVKRWPVHVPDRPVNSHRKTSLPRSATHETHSVASQKQLEGTGISREGYPSTQVPAPTFTMVARGKQCAPGSTITPNKTCSANLHRRIKRRVGRSLKRAHCKRVLVSAGKQAAHKLPRAKSGLSGSERVPRPLRKSNSPSGHRQYYRSSLHKQRRRHEVGPTLCSTVENLDLVFPTSSDFNLFATKGTAFYYTEGKSAMKSLQTV